MHLKKKLQIQRSISLRQIKHISLTLNWKLWSQERGLTIETPPHTMRVLIISSFQGH